MEIEEAMKLMWEGIVKGITFVVVRRTLEGNEKTTHRPRKQKGGFFKKNK